MNLFDYVQNELNITLNTQIENTGMADSTQPRTISFLDNPKFAKQITGNLNVVAVFVKKDHKELLPNRMETIVVENPKARFFDMHNNYYKKYIKYSPTIISDDAFVHDTAFVSPIGVKIGAGSYIGPHATILSGTEIGNNSTIGPNSVIGYEGFHVYSDIGNIKQIVFHDGKVIIGDNVDIQASVTVDKGLMGRDTVISDGCKLDNFVHIAHRVNVAQNVLIASGSCVAGSVDVGENVWIGPGSVISNRIKVGDNARILLGSVVIRNVKAGNEVSGNFAMLHTKNLLLKMERI